MAKPSEPREGNRAAIDVGIDDIGRMLGLVVHDLRNPAATISANIAYLKEVRAEGSKHDEEAEEALADIEGAIGELTRGLLQLAFVGRWLAGEPACRAADSDLRVAVQHAATRAGGLELMVEAAENAPIRARSGDALAQLLDLLIANAKHHGRGAKPRLVLRREGDDIALEIRDAGRALASELTDDAFTIPGQQVVKTRADGRYARFAGLVAARALADTLGARIETGGVDGDAIFRIRLRAL